MIEGGMAQSSFARNLTLRNAEQLYVVVEGTLTSQLHLHSCPRHRQGDLLDE
jgi:hypothetical protein